MSVNIYNAETGRLQKIAGHGSAEYGASTVRSGTVTLSITETTDHIQKTITFSDPMPDNDYVLDIYLSGENGCHKIQWCVTSKTKNGFTILCWDNNYEMALIPGWSFVFIYTAFKLYTDTEYNKLLDSVHINIADKTTLSASTHLLISSEYWIRDDYWFVALRDRVVTQNTNVTFTINLSDYLKDTSAYIGVISYGRSGFSGTPSLSNKIITWTPDTDYGQSTKYDLDVVLYGNL